jgi:hypothetical protein
LVLLVAIGPAQLRSALSAGPMNIRANPELKGIKDALIEEMLDYRAEGGASYTKADVEKCQRLLDRHLVAISGARDRNSAKECVKATVVKLNQLNKKAGYELIETGQREDICKFLIRAGELLGFNGPKEDITEEWRDW